MSNIAGKAYAMNVITPLRWYTAWLNKLFFWASGMFPVFVEGLITLSLIHYARWVIIRPKDFPRVSDDQPREDLHYNYMLFFSNFNGSWSQYVDSFSSSIPDGLDKYWMYNIGYPKSVPMLPFHNYITANQIWTGHYFNPYPMASSNDVKSAQKLKDALVAFEKDTSALSPEAFKQQYDKLTLSLQHDISQMAPTPVVSLSAAASEKRRIEERREETH